MKQDIIAPEEVGMSSKRLERIRPIMQGYVDQKKDRRSEHNDSPQG